MGGGGGSVGRVGVVPTALDFSPFLESLADLRGGAPGARPPHLPGILVFIGGSMGRARCAPPHLPGILVFDDILGHVV